MSVEIALGGFTFGFNTTFASIHTDGTLPSLVTVGTKASSEAHSLKLSNVDLG